MSGSRRRCYICDDPCESTGITPLCKSCSKQYGAEPKTQPAAKPEPAKQDDGLGWFYGIPTITQQNEFAVFSEWLKVEGLRAPLRYVNDHKAYCGIVNALWEERTKK